MTKVYVVMGDTGEYSDRTEWSVSAYLDESKAAAHVARLDAWLIENKVSRNHADVLVYEDRDKLRTPDDPHFTSDYTGTRYLIMAVELAD